jgi:hypothetical protein
MSVGGNRGSKEVVQDGDFFYLITNIVLYIVKNINVQGQNIK